MFHMRAKRVAEEACVAGGLWHRRMQARLCVCVAPLMLSLCAIVSFPASSAAEQATVSPIPGGHAGLFRGRGNERIEAHQTSSRSEESRGGKEWVSTCRMRWEPEHEKKTIEKN